MRVVSLLPGATETLVALGLADRLVGRSHECAGPPEVMALPVVTASEIDPDLPSAALDSAVGDRVARALSLYRVDAARLAALRPDVILTQTLCAVCAVDPADLAAHVATLGAGIRLAALGATDLAGVLADIGRVAAAAGAPERAPPLVAALRARLDRLAARLAGAPRPRLAMVEWLAPLMIAGNWGPELATWAGAEPVLAQPGAHTTRVTLEALVAADPDAILLAPCSFPVARTRLELGATLGVEPHWQGLRAVRSGQVHLADGARFFNRPGPGLVESAELLAALLHPGRAGDLKPAGADATV